MSEFTVEQLISAIRNADDLSDLKRMVGASEREWGESSKRLAEIDRIGEKYGYDTDAMPWPDAERYKSLMAEQDAFESQYA